MTKRITALLLILLMLLTLVPTAALAEVCDTVHVRMSSDTMFDDEHLLIPGYWMGKIAQFDNYYVQSQDWYRDGEYDGPGGDVCAPHAVYTVDVLYQMYSPENGNRFAEQPRFVVQEGIELLSYELVDGGKGLRVKIQLKSEPALSSITLVPDANTFTESGVLKNGAKLPAFYTEGRVANCRVFNWKKDGEFISYSNAKAVAGSSYEVFMTIRGDEHHSVDMNTEIITPAGMTETHRELDIYDLTVYFTVKTEPKPVIEHISLTLNDSNFYDDTDSILAGSWVRHVPLVSEEQMIDPIWSIQDRKHYVGGIDNDSGFIQANKEYKTTFRIVPKAGFSLADELTVECPFAESIVTEKLADGSMFVTMVMKVTDAPVRKSIEVICPDLEVGKKPVSFNVLEYAAFKAKAAEWVCLDTGETLDKMDKIEHGSTYMAKLYIAGIEPVTADSNDTEMSHWGFYNFDRPSDDPNFTAPEVTVTLNGKAADRVYGIKTGDYAGCLCMEYTFPPIPAVPPQITSQPRGLNLDEGEDAVFTVECVGKYLKYQWYVVKNGTQTALEGETSPTLTIKNVSVAEHYGTAYCCRIENSGGVVSTINAKLNVSATPLIDVVPGTVYYDAIVWAYKHEPQQITGGYTATEFRPGNPCTRGQVVTFLWRAAGCPEPTGENPFVDVENSGSCKPYYKAILWAAEKGITTGFDATHFAPHSTVTRAQFVTFLWRYEGKPDTTGSINGFKDAGNIAKPYQTAVAWAVEKGITTGYGDNTFRPNDTCTRWAVVLFMYRDMK